MTTTKECDCLAVLRQIKDAFETLGMNMEAKGVAEAAEQLRAHQALRDTFHDSQGKDKA